MNEDRLRELMREPAPGEREAEERGLAIARAAFEARQPSARRPRARLALICALLLIAVALLAVTPAGGAITDFIGDRIGGVEGEQPSQPALTGLPPSAGEVLVNSARGPWVVQADGSRRLLGDYQDASWSPHGLFVVATRGRQLIAMTPEGQVHWSLARARPVSDPRWSPDGYRIAYPSGPSLRVVNGDGSADRLLVERTARLAPAWRPGKGHVLAFADASGRVAMIDTDSRRLLWRSQSATPPSELAWSDDGRRLAVLLPHGVRVFSADGRFLAELPLGSLSSPVRLGTGDARLIAFARRSHQLAVVWSTSSLHRSDVVLWRADRRGFGPPKPIPEPVVQRLFSGRGEMTSLAWSPLGSWLLVAWRSADQWIFLRPNEKGIYAVSNIARQFDPGGRGQQSFPSVSGWCCPP